MVKKALQAKKDPKSKRNKPQKILALIVDDSEDDAQLLVRKLEKGGYNPIWERVNTAAAMKKALKEKQWDIILCDYNMSDFNAPIAIVLLEKIKIDIPIIIVSGAIREETAIECMRLGARDYIMKSNLTRLCPIIAKELEYVKVRDNQRRTANELASRHKRVEEELWESEEKYRSLFENSIDAILLTMPDGRIMAANPAACRMFGRSEDEICRIGRAGLLDKTNSLLEAGLEERKRTGRFEGELTCVRKDGTKFIGETSTSIFKDRDGNLRTSMIIRDITGRKLVEEALISSEEKFSKAFLYSPNATCISTLSEGRFVDVNHVYLNTLGYKREEIIGRTSTDINLWADMAEREAMVKALIQTGRVTGFEAQFYDRQGNIHWGLTSVSFIKTEGESYLLTQTLDITERKKAERLLREKDELLRGIAKNLPGVIYQFYVKDSGEYGMSYISEPLDKFSKIIVSDDTVNLDTFFSSFVSRVYEEDRDRFLASIEKAVETVTPWNFEGRIALPSGKMVWFQGLSIPTRYENQTVLNGILLNITERKLAEEKSRESEEKFRKIFMTSPDCIAIIRMSDGSVIDVNEGFEDIVGWKREQVIGMKPNYSSFKFWVDSSERELMLADLKAGLAVLHRDIEFRRGDGSLRNGIYSARPINIDDEECIIFILQDITERKLAEEKSHQSEEKFRNIFMTTPDCIGITRLKDRTLVDVNKGCEDMLGWQRENVIGKNTAEPPLNFWVDLSAREFMVAELKAGRDVLHRDIEFRRGDGSLRHGIYSARSIKLGDEESFIFIMQDITDQKRMEKELVASQKAKLMEQITAGVAHEVRNPLHAIQAISEAMVVDMDEKSDYKDYLVHIKAQVARLSHLMNDLLELGKPSHSSSFREASITEVTETSLAFWMDTHPHLSRNVRVVNKLQSNDLALVEARKIQQVIINLMENASQHSSPDEEILLELDKAFEKYVIVRITDRGTGIKPRDMPHVFEPFYTARKGGTGLGLSICKHIIESHGGSIEITNNKNEPGCTVWFTIPVCNNKEHK